MSGGSESESTDPKWKTVAEPTVQVPVSLIERAGNALLEVPPSSVNASIYSELHALLSQPTPTAEPNNWANGHRWPCTRFYTSATERDACTCNAAPPSITDMVPGTTFTAKTPTGWRRCLRATGFGVYVAEGQWDYSRIDPSTIRDVTPPRPATVRQDEPKWNAT